MGVANCPGVHEAFSQAAFGYHFGGVPQFVFCRPTFELRNVTVVLDPWSLAPLGPSVQYVLILNSPQLFLTLLTKDETRTGVAQARVNLFDGIAPDGQILNCLSANSSNVVEAYQFIQGFTRALSDLSKAR